MASRDGRQRRDRPDISVHDGRLGWKDPNGLLVALCHGASDRPARQIRRRFRQRHRCRPARNRDPIERPDEPQSLSRGRHMRICSAIVPIGAVAAPLARPSSAVPPLVLDAAFPRNPCPDLTARIAARPTPAMPSSTARRLSRMLSSAAPAGIRLNRLLNVAIVSAKPIASGGQ